MPILGKMSDIRQFTDNFIRNTCDKEYMEQMQDILQVNNTVYNYISEALNFRLI